MGLEIWILVGGDRGLDVTYPLPWDTVDHRQFVAHPGLLYLNQTAMDRRHQHVEVEALPGDRGHFLAAGLG